MKKIEKEQPVWFKIRHDFDHRFLTKEENELFLFGTREFLRKRVSFLVSSWGGKFGTGSISINLDQPRS